MEKKTRLISLKTFEDFKADNANYYGEVLAYFKSVLEYLNTNGVKPIQTKYNIDMVDAGDWKIEGTIYTSDLQTEDDTLDTELTFHNVNEQDSILVNVTGYGETVHDSPGDYETPPEFESDSHLSIESVVLFKEDGAYDYSIAVSAELENIILEIVNKIAK